MRIYGELTPYGRDLRGNLVSLDPFFVAVSVSINDQQFFPQVSSPSFQK